MKIVIDQETGQQVLQITKDEAITIYQCMDQMNGNPMSTWVKDYQNEMRRTFCLVRYAWQHIFDQRQPVDTANRNLHSYERQLFQEHPGTTFAERLAEG